MSPVPRAPAPEGTLREALSYPLPPQDFTDAVIFEAMDCAGLAWLAPRLDDRDDWDQVLSRRTRQRIGFARALLQRPAWLIMEEATDAFEPEGEKQILAMLRRELPDATLVTITFRFRPDLEALHDRTVFLNMGPKSMTGVEDHPADRDRRPSEEGHDADPDIDSR